MRTVFVLMPFGGDFDDIYMGIIKPAFESKDFAEFQVKRADDIESQQNILKDIVQQIADADLVVADLTGGNPNVFYELALAHALRRPAILITQDLSDVPFDLRSYRVLEYSTHFIRAEKAKATLESYARSFIDGSLKTGSPVSDFLSDEQISRPIEHMDRNTADRSDDEGFLDSLIALADGYGEIAEIIQEITDSMDSDVTKPTGDASAELERLGKSTSQDNVRAAQRVAQRLARNYSSFNAKLARANVRYGEIASETDRSLELVVSFVLSQSSAPNADVERELTRLRTFRDSAIEAQEGCERLAENVDSVPRIERHLRRSMRELSEELREFSNNIGKTIASINRALSIWESKREGR